MKLALGQINPTVGDLAGNTGRMIEAARQAASGGADLVIFPELAVSGYPPRDLVEIRRYLERNESELQRLARETSTLGLAVISGYAGLSDQSEHQSATNCAAYLRGGKVVSRQRKMLLPTYDVFDEWRYFAPADSQQVWEHNGCRIAVTICEDVWNDKQFWDRRRYQRDPVEELAQQGMDLIINIAASPYHIHKRKQRLDMIAATARRWGVPIVMVNQVGGNDQLIFDGSSFVVGPDGVVRAQARSFEADLVFYDTVTNEGDIRRDDQDEYAAVYNALVMGTRDYVRKCGFESVIIALSGGMDSSLTAVIAVDALGAENVTGVGMPGPHSSAGSVNDAKQLAEALQIRFEIISINNAYASMTQALAPLFGDRPPGTAEENLQARLRGDTVMALSNKFGSMVLTTGNKSEAAVGYCTLYGDMAGGLAVISDVPKTLVYKLARVANQRHPGVIPESVFTKPPSAELRPDQKDTDSLPAYEVLDPILQLYVEHYADPSTIAEKLGVSEDLVRDVTSKVDRNEYKRQQAAPGLRVTSKAFGMGRRFPIAQRYSP
ncbi:MAG TPA: NAD+ synthase [Bryobacterales bacterium]|nr:NAD+ synthase [Bryobacterales bacterium]